MNSEINHFDIVFVVDTTSSMGTFIASAKELMVGMVESLAGNANVNILMGVVEYRDHPPQDHRLVDVHNLAPAAVARKKIAALSPSGGGDGPEAVLDGVAAACKKILWRKHSRKIAILFGDAPPHGVGAAGDGFPKGCPCGETIESVSALAEEAGITVYGVPLEASASASFAKLAQLTGGESFTVSQGRNAIEKIQTILNEEFGNLALDRKVLDLWDDEATVDTVAEKLSAKPSDVAASYMRLCRRALIGEVVFA